SRSTPLRLPRNRGASTQNFRSFGRLTLQNRSGRCAGFPRSRPHLGSGRIMLLFRDPHPRLSRVVTGGVFAGLSILLAAPASSPPDEPALAGPVPVAPAAVAPVVVPALSFEDCLHLGRENQPSIRAALASLSAAQNGQRGLNEIRFGSRLSKDLPIRKEQAAHGVAAQAANLRQVQRDVDASVARMYYSVIYARMQLKVAQQISDRLKAVVSVGETLLGKEGAPPDLNALQIGKAKLFMALAQARVDEATRGLQRATAALREAMGLCPEYQFTVAEGKLPDVLQGVNKDEIVRLATCLRGEVSMVNSGAAIARLEIDAQNAVRRVRRPTAAQGGDMHARPVPTGSFGEDTK